MGCREERRLEACQQVFVIAGLQEVLATGVQVSAEEAGCQDCPWASVAAIAAFLGQVPGFRDAVAEDCFWHQAPSF